jgi:hypothetical protein
MKADSRWILVAAPVLAIGLIAGLPTAAQEDAAEEPEYDGHYYFYVEAFYSQPAGGELFPAAKLDPQSALVSGNPLAQVSKELGIGFEAETRGRYQFGYKFNGKIGAIVLTWFSHSAIETMSEYDPGNFVYGATNVSPLYAGLFLNGLADGFESRGELALRDFRIDFAREAFSSPRITGRWFAGIRRVWHRRSLETWYLAMAPDLPPILPPLSEPRPDLAPGFCDVFRPDPDVVIPGCRPVTDQGLTYSDVDYRGVEAGFDVDLTLIKRKLFMTASLGIGLGRGRQNTEYRGRSAVYVITDGVDDVQVLTPPYDEFNEYNIPGDPNSGAVVDRIEQIPIGQTVTTVNESMSSSILEAHLGFKWIPWRTLAVHFGFRQTRYEDIGVVVMPSNPTPAPTTDPEKLTVWNTQVSDRTEYSLTYEGYYLGVSYLF